MERYYQLIEQLAEWFMQLFFDPAYHLVGDQKPQNIITRKQQEVSDWWIKQKAALQNLGKQVVVKKVSKKLVDRLISLPDTVRIQSGVTFYFSQRWVQLIQ